MVAQHLPRFGLYGETGVWSGFSSLLFPSVSCPIRGIFRPTQPQEGQKKEEKPMKMRRIRGGYGWKTGENG